MLFKLFNSNKPIVLTILPILGVVLWFPSFFISHPKVSAPSPFYSYLDALHGPIGNSLAIIVIILTGIFLSFIINKSEFFEKAHFLPAILYLLIMSSLKELHCQNPIIYSNLFLVLAFGKIVKINQQNSCKNDLFLGSCFFLLAALFYIPYLMFFPLTWIALSLIRSFQLKEWIIPVISIVVFALHIATFYSVFPEFIPELNTFNNAGFIIDSIIPSSILLYLFFSIIVISSIGSLLILINQYKSSRNRFKKLSILLFIFVVFSLSHLVFYYLLGNVIISVLIQAVPLSLLISYVLFYNYKSWVSETILICCFLSLIANFYFF